MCCLFYFELVLCLENLENIYRTFSSMVFNLALYYTRNTQDTEEITQDVFLKIHDKGYVFRGESELKTWIYRISINRSLDVLKNKKSKKNTPWQFSIQPDLFPGGTFKTDENPHKTLENKQQLNSLIQCIHQLYRQLVDTAVVRRDSLIAAIGEVQRNIEYIHWNHFKDIEALCLPNQKAYFAELQNKMAQLFTHASHPPRQ